MGTEWADALVASLPPDQRAVVALRVTADLPINEVAIILGKRTGAVKARFEVRFPLSETSGSPR